MKQPCLPATRMWFGSGAALVLVACWGACGTGEPPFGEDFPPSMAAPSFTVVVGNKVTVGGPKSDNFLPDTLMDVYVVPHRVWKDGDPLAANAVHRVRVRSTAKGQLPLTPLWTPNRAGVFDIIVDYDGDGKFSYGLDALSAFDVRAK